jgi:hypothetical protein
LQDSTDQIQQEKGMQRYQMKLLKIGLIAQVYETRAEEQTNMFQSTW